MKKTILTILVFLMLILPACAGQSPATDSLDSAPTATKVATPVKQNSAATPTATTTQGASTTVELNTSYENATSIELQLLAGTLKLTGTDSAVTKEQVNVLLPLWNNLKTISRSMTPAQGGPAQGQSNATPQPPSTNTETQQQIDALTKQIVAAMTPKQIKAFAEMKITQATAMTIMQEQGITMGGPQPGNGNSAGSGNQLPSGAPPAGGQQPPQGTPPAGAPPADQPPSDRQQPGNAQMSAPPAGGGMTPPELIDAVLQLLEKINAGQSTSASAQTTAGSAASTSTSSGTLAAYTQNGGTATKTSQTYTASGTDESGVYVTSAGNLTLTNSTITTSGNTSSSDKSSFYGLNAAVLAANASTINLSNSLVTTSGTGANGVFATGSGSSAILSKVTIKASADGGHGVMATNGGALTLTDVNMSTAGANSGAIATDRGDDRSAATGGIVTTSGQDSPGIYSTGAITVSDATLTASGAEAAVIEGANSITLKNTSLSSSKESKWGVMIYQSMSGDAQGTKGIFTMTGGSLAYTASSGPLFYVTNSTGVITLKGVNVTATSGTLVKASAGNWGTSGSNGGTVILTADGQTLTGNLVADSISSITATLQNGSSLTGAINVDNAAKAVNLALDSSSTWTVTADSYLTCLTDPNGISDTTITNITGNGHTAYYDTSACSALGGQTYTLSGGGYLKPDEQTFQQFYTCDHAQFHEFLIAPA